MFKQALIAAAAISLAAPSAAPAVAQSMGRAETGRSGKLRRRLSKLA